MNHISWLNWTVNAGMIHENLVNPGVHRSLDIDFDTIPDHNTFSLPGICFSKSILEDLLIGFNAVTTLRSNDFEEISCNARIF